jgi:hypothetical protein
MRARSIAIAIAAAAVSGGAVAQDTPAPGVEFVFAETVTLGKVVEVGKTVRGERRIIPITGGHFEGPQIRGEVMPGGWDWQLTRADGCTDVKADYFLKTDDGVVINVVNTGEICPGEKGAPAAVRTHPVFEPPLGKYEWLGKQAFVGTLGMAPAKEGPAVLIRFYRVK